MICMKCQNIFSNKKLEKSPNYYLLSACYFCSRTWVNLLQICLFKIRQCNCTDAKLFFKWDPHQAKTCSRWHSETVLFHFSEKVRLEIWPPPAPPLQIPYMNYQALISRKNKTYFSKWCLLLLRLHFKVNTHKKACNCLHNLIRVLVSHQ